MEEQAVSVERRTLMNSYHSLQNEINNLNSLKSQIDTVNDKMDCKDDLIKEDKSLVLKTGQDKNDRDFIERFDELTQELQDIGKYLHDKIGRVSHMIS